MNATTELARLSRAELERMVVTVTAELSRLQANQVTVTEAMRIRSVIAALASIVELETGETYCGTLAEARELLRALQVPSVSFAASTMGRKGGQVRTAAKVSAARRNGAKGGRPPGSQD